MLFRNELRQAIKENDLSTMHVLLCNLEKEGDDLHNFDILQEALWWAVKRGHAHLVRALLVIPCVLNNAHAANNRALSYAIESRQTNIAHALLDVLAVQMSVNNQIWQKAISMRQDRVAARLGSILGTVDLTCWEEELSGEDENSSSTKSINAPSTPPLAMRYDFRKRTRNENRDFNVSASTSRVKKHKP